MAATSGNRLRRFPGLMTPVFLQPIAQGGTANGAASALALRAPETRYAARNPCRTR